MIPLPDFFFCWINESKWLLLRLFLQGDHNSMKTFYLALHREIGVDTEESSLPGRLWPWYELLFKDAEHILTLIPTGAALKCIARPGTAPRPEPTAAAAPELCAAAQGAELRPGGSRARLQQSSPMLSLCPWPSSRHSFHRYMVLKQHLGMEGWCACISAVMERERQNPLRGTEKSPGLVTVLVLFFRLGSLSVVPPDARLRLNLLTAFAQRKLTGGFVDHRWMHPTS